MKEGSHFLQVTSEHDIMEITVMDVSGLNCAGCITTQERGRLAVWVDSVTTGVTEKAEQRRKRQLECISHQLYLYVRGETDNIFV
jgi:hypothetical protein